METGSQGLKREIARLFSKGRQGASQGIDLDPGCPFGAVVEQRLREMERSVSEIKAKVNGLIFLVVGAVIAVVITRLF